MDKNSGGFSNQDVTAIETAVTETVNYLDGLGGKRVRIKVGGKTTFASAAQIRDGIVNATLDTKAVPKNFKGGYASTSNGGILRSPLSRAPATITFNSNWKEGARDYGRLFGGKDQRGKGAIYIVAHEGAHAHFQIDRPFRGLYSRSQNIFNQYQGKGAHGEAYFRSIGQQLLGF